MVEYGWGYGQVWGGVGEVWGMGDMDGYGGGMGGVWGGMGRPWFRVLGKGPRVLERPIRGA